MAVNPEALIPHEAVDIATVREQLQGAVVIKYLQYRFIMDDLQSAEPRGAIVDLDKRHYRRHGDGYEYTLPTDEEVAELERQQAEADCAVRRNLNMSDSVDLGNFKAIIRFIPPDIGGNDQNTFYPGMMNSINQGMGHSVYSTLISVRELARLTNTQFLTPTYPYSPNGAGYEKIDKSTDIDAIVTHYCLNDIERFEYWNDKGLNYPLYGNKPEARTAESIVSDYGIPIIGDQQVQAFWARLHALGYCR